MKAARIIIYNQDGESQEVEGFAEASRLTGLSISWIREMIAKGRQSDSGYSFDYHPDYIHNNVRYLIELTDPNGCVYEQVDTVVQACIIMGCSRDTVVRKAIPKGEYNGWKIKTTKHLS